jgi:CheY-like chemotaxis protein
MKPQDQVLLVEDDLVEVLTFKRALRDLDLDRPLQVASTGEDALQLLAEAEAELPKLILLDLNMPRMGGIEFLMTIKMHPLWRRIPVIILTTSNQEQERQQCFDLSVAGYIIKPMDYNAFVEVVKVICAYWCINESGE